MRLPCFATLVCVLGLTLPLYADSPIPEPPPAVTKPLPESIDDLRAIQNQVKAVIEKVMPSTVGLRVGGASGSGVIVKDNYVLTAGHVSSTPGQPVDIILHTGKIIKGKTLGCNRGIDSGLIQITTPGEWPAAEMGTSADLKLGTWCIAIGHPNGYQVGRSPVVRVGRVVKNEKTGIDTDCALVGGDSGGPLYDMQGRVIGIHSRIGGTLLNNTHVPIDTYRQTWDRLTKGEEWGRGFGSVGGGPRRPSGYLGVTKADNTTEAKIGSVTEGSPAEKGGIKPGDLVTKFDGKEIKTYDELAELIASKRPDTEVEIVVKRGSETVTLKIKLGRR